MSKTKQQNVGLQVKNLSCIRGARVLFERLSLTLRPSETIVVLGPNGSGKTSLLRLISGLLAVQEGEFIWQNETSSNPRDLMAGSIHYLGHTHALKPFLTVRENLSLWGKLFGAGFDIEAAAKKVRISEFLDFPVKYLSEGQRKRVDLARFLTKKLPLWIMDEPLSGLDSEGQKVLEEIITQHTHDEGMAIIASHHPLDLKKTKKLHLEKGRAKWI